MRLLVVLNISILCRLFLLKLSINPQDPLVEGVALPPLLRFCRPLNMADGHKSEDSSRKAAASEGDSLACKSDSSSSSEEDDTRGRSEGVDRAKGQCRQTPKSFGLNECASNDRAGEESDKKRRRKRSLPMTMWSFQPYDVPKPRAGQSSCKPMSAGTSSYTASAHDNNNLKCVIVHTDAPGDNPSQTCALPGIQNMAKGFGIIAKQLKEPFWESFAPEPADEVMKERIARMLHTHGIESQCGCGKFTFAYSHGIVAIGLATGRRQRTENTILALFLIHADAEERSMYHIIRKGVCEAYLNLALSFVQARPLDPTQIGNVLEHADFKGLTVVTSWVPPHDPSSLQQTRARTRADQSDEEAAAQATAKPKSHGRKAPRGSFAAGLRPPSRARLHPASTPSQWPHQACGSGVPPTPPPPPPRGHSHAFSWMPPNTERDAPPRTPIRGITRRRSRTPLGRAGGGNLRRNDNGVDARP